MPRSRIGPLLRMSLGSGLGIIGFGTLSMGFVHLSTANLALGLIEILLGAFVALGVLTPLKKRKARSEKNPTGPSHKVTVR